ncbi:hypothetical protein EXIGLDRAFT_707166 [Exidia glandulosa HHB12029]|uniref:Uncharacterized protein n=1 Tax=Exidia glandulosa HHB12029 TaxID=1314781 RepID=A0A165AT36_EXIGL|nr:hypothetical protein EXIGLDRAFT_707166 [Exidia glandulosa HHB12029]
MDALNHLLLSPSFSDSMPSDDEEEVEHLMELCLAHGPKPTIAEDALEADTEDSVAGDYVVGVTLQHPYTSMDADSDGSDTDTDSVTGGGSDADDESASEADDVSDSESDDDMVQSGAYTRRTEHSQTQIICCIVWNNTFAAERPRNLIYEASGGTFWALRSLPAGRRYALHFAKITATQGPCYALRGNKKLTYSSPASDFFVTIPKRRRNGVEDDDAQRSAKRQRYTTPPVTMDPDFGELMKLLANAKESRVATPTAYDGPRTPQAQITHSLFKFTRHD